MPLVEPIKPTFSAEVKAAVGRYYRMATPGAAECAAFDAWNAAWREYNQARSLWAKQQIEAVFADIAKAYAHV